MLHAIILDRCHIPFPASVSGGSQNAMTNRQSDADPQPEILIATSTAVILMQSTRWNVYFQKNIGQQSRPAL
jgi:hypothetical protein